MLRSWKMNLEVDPASNVPLFVQLSRAIVRDVERGRLSPGDALPGTRAMAQRLGIHRNTVDAAYRELIQQGWAAAEPSRGTFISTTLPVKTPKGFGSSPRQRMPQQPAFPLETPRGVREDVAASAARGVLIFNDGTPDVRLAPSLALARAFRRVLTGRARTTLGAGDARGEPLLRGSLARMLSETRGLAAGEDDVLVTRGSQMALFLVAQALVRPGDVIAVEALGYRPAWDALRLAGARLVGLPVDGEGLRVDALRTLLAQGPVRAVFVTPHHQYPTTVTLTVARRLELLRLAAESGVAVVEDDYDHEFHYEGRPVLPLASADRSGSVVYVGSLSKIMAPGLRLGYVVAPAPVVRQLAALRAVVDRQGDAPLERAVAELLEEGELQRHARRARREYLARRDALAEALHGALEDHVDFEVPAGGLALWVRIREGREAGGWAERARAEGVHVTAGHSFALEGQGPEAFRLGFASLNPTELREAVRRLARAR
ncbi:GntR family transcriptional regulator [Cystobacter fuscus]|uniref:GntR family transcriptional regulator n=1 Tax=Cystobacter fuscus TaxID=43 RepID=A0A250JCX9_9BACT|nr:PLP-dependent aminotransferase family protein [Cystobacter fuscus]ATB41241.1 GntR family transcriptional regulator [Cystobacter fuscus]